MKMIIFEAKITKIEILSMALISFELSFGHEYENIMSKKEFI